VTKIQSSVDYYRKKGYIIGDNTVIENNVEIEGNIVEIGNDVYLANGVRIKSDLIRIGDNSIFYSDINIRVSKVFSIGNRCKISRGARFKAHEIYIGNELWCNENVEIGGGGSGKKSAILTVGDFVHIGKNASINVCKKVSIGNKTGIGIESIIFTHSSGNGQSIFEGYSHVEEEVHVGNNVSIYSRAIIAPGTVIEDGVTVGALSYVHRTLESNSLYAGVPAKKIKTIKKLSDEDKFKCLLNLLEYELHDTAVYSRNENTFSIPKDNSCIYIYKKNSKMTKVVLNKLSNSYKSVIAINFANDLGCNAKTEINLWSNYICGETTEITELIRDILRRYGIVLNWRDYEPYKLNYNLFREKGIEL